MIQDMTKFAADYGPGIQLRQRKNLSLKGASSWMRYLRDANT